MTVTPEAIHVLVNPKEYNALGRGDLRKIVADLKSGDPDLIKQINTSLNQVYIGDKSLVDLLQDAMQAGSNNFQQGTYPIDGIYYEISIEPTDGSNTVYKIFEHDDGKLWIAKKVPNGWALIVTLTSVLNNPNSPETEGFDVNMQEVIEPMSVPTTQLGLPQTDTLGSESDELPIITASPLLKENFKKIIDSLVNLIALPSIILVLLWFIGWTIGAVKPKYLEKGVEKVGKIGKKKK